MPPAEVVVAEPPVLPPEPPELEEAPGPHAAIQAEDKVIPIENKRVRFDIEIRYQAHSGCKAIPAAKRHEWGDKAGLAGVRWRFLSGLAGPDGGRVRSFKLLVRIGSRPFVALEIVAIILLLKACANTAAPTGCAGDCGGQGGSPFGDGGSYVETGGGPSPSGGGGAGGSGGTGGLGGTTGGSGGATSTCEPATCGAQTCGSIQDGCGGEVTCGGNCPSPQKCKTTCVCALAPLNPLQCGNLLPAYCGGPGVTLPDGCVKLGAGADGKIVSCCPFDKVN